MNSPDGPHKHTIDSFQDRIDYHVREANRLRYARNSHVAVSRLLTELLSEVFFLVVRSGLQGGDTYFAPGTFDFRHVCKRWNEVAVGSPRLWNLWVVGAVQAWPLFNSRLKSGPLSLTWRPQLPASARDILMDPTIPRRLRQLDFSGTSDQLAHLLGVFDSGPPSNVSSIRLHINPYNDREPQQRLARLVSSPLPNLSRLNIENFLPTPSSPIFTTSKLISLRLFLPYETYERKGRYTLGQLSKILRQHPTLEELDLNHAAVPLPSASGTCVPFVLPRLVDLRLHGTSESILGLIDLIGMSSPLHNVVIRFAYDPNFNTPHLIGIMEKILVAYYDRQGPDCPRKHDTLAISFQSNSSTLTFDAGSRSTSTANLELQFKLTDEILLEGDKMIEKALALFTSSDIQVLDVEGFSLTFEMIQKTLPSVFLFGGQLRRV